jgi:signal transduction histidine kinase/ActR/RegA family two-component response regulator
VSIPHPLKRLDEAAHGADAANGVSPVTTKDRTTNTLRQLFLRRSVPYVLFVLAYGLSVAASWYMSSTAAVTAETRARTEFLADAQQTRRQIQAGLNTYFEVVRTGAVLLASDNEINGADFRRFVTGLQINERYPGLEGIGFAQCVTRPRLRPLLRSLDLDGNRIAVWPTGPRDEFCPTLFFEPSNKASKSLGFDLASDPTLVATMAEARDSQQPGISGNLANLPVWRGGRGANLALFIPVYRLARPVNTVEERRRALMGFVFSPIDSRRLLQDIVASTTPSIAFDVYNGPAPSPAALLSQSAVDDATGRYQFNEIMDVAGRQWLIAMRSVGEPASSIPLAARQTLLVGVILSFMLFLVTAAQVRAWETAARHELELRASEQALRESEAQAQAANRAKDEFLAPLSHELRTPLNVVLGWVSMLRLGSVREDRRSEALEIIERNARQQAELIDDLLDVSRIVTGKLRLQLRPLPLAPITAAVVESLRPSADAKSISMAAPTIVDAFTIRGDADRLRQITWNLVSNAIKFTPAGGQISVSLTRQDQTIRLAVRDSGIGIAKEFLPHVFERFRQADSSTTRTHGGVGLGLAIVRHLVELHGGTIEVTSEGRNRGTEFTVSFPVAPMATMAALVPVVASHPTQAARLDGVRVLVVDDDPNTLDLLTEALATTGAQVTAAGSARSALERLRADGADIIVSDIAMPDEDGFWLMNRIRSLPGQISRTPAIALTALARTEDRRRVMEAGYQMHLTKPVQLGELQEGLATLVAHSGTV